MGTRADYYIGRGEVAEWLGSTGYDGYPDGQEPALLNATSEEEFRAAIESMMLEDHATRPNQGWPWPWEDSHLTDYSYAFDNGQVWMSSFGRPWSPANKPEPAYYDSWEDFDKDMVSSHFTPKEIEKHRKVTVIGNDKGATCAQCGNEHHPSVTYPNMKSRQNITLGKRSGVMFIEI